MCVMEQPNLEYIEKVSSGSHDFKCKIIAIIKEELPKEVAQYRNAIAVQDYQKAANTVHKLKHKIAVFGFDKSYDTAQSFEEELKKGEVSLQKKFETIVSIIENFVVQL